MTENPIRKINLDESFYISYNYMCSMNDVVKAAIKCHEIDEKSVCKMVDPIKLLKAYVKDWDSCIDKCNSYLLTDE